MANPAVATVHYGLFICLLLLVLIVFSMTHGDHNHMFIFKHLLNILLIVQYIASLSFIC